VLGREAAARCPACEDRGCTKAGVVDLRDVAVKVVCRTQRYSVTHLGFN
jgi:hypothetical protein